ncbi:MAG: fatty acid desaturase [Planctomycetaceae bacterium]
MSSSRSATPRQPAGDPTAGEVRAQLDDDCRVRSYAKGLSLFAVTAACYLGTLTAALAAPTWSLRLLFGLLNGVSIASLFVIGHDACHGSLTPSQTLNRWLGRLCLLPSLTPAIAWIHSHNGMHHGWTSLKSKDPVYAPLSKTEYDAFPIWRRGLERVYRSVPGIGMLYLCEVWWKLEMFPAEKDAPRGKAIHTFRKERLAVIAFAAVVVALAAIAPSPPLGPLATTVLASVAVAAVLPYLLWNWMMAFSTFQHHTHPNVPWYDDEEEWSFFKGQVRSGVHVRLPRTVEVLLHNIMDHTAHHVDQKIPLYNLPGQQRRLEAAYPDDVTISPWEFFAFGRTLMKCQLYDYENHRWLKFDGTPTTGRLVPERPVEEARRAAA